MTKCALSNCESSQESTVNILSAEVEVFAQTGNSDRKPVCFLLTKGKKCPVWEAEVLLFL